LYTFYFAQRVDKAFLYLMLQMIYDKMVNKRGLNAKHQREDSGTESQRQEGGKHKEK
jgi:hypothetical protein